MLMEKSKITIKKIETRYILTDEKGRTISVIVHDDGRISIYRHSYFNESFHFEHSDRKIVEAVAKLLLEAAKLK